MIIGLAGPANSGKDTVAEIILNTFPNFYTDSFAYGVKQIVCELFSVDRDFIETYKRNPENAPGLNMSMRDILRFIGDGVKKIKPSVWIDDLFKRTNNKHVIVTDVRYIDEMEELKKRGAFILLIGRHENNIDQHASEITTSELVNSYFAHDSNNKHEHLIDCFIKNDGTLDDLEKNVKNTIFPLIHEQIA